MFYGPNSCSSNFIVDRYRYLAIPALSQTGRPTKDAAYRLAFYVADAVRAVLGLVPDVAPLIQHLFQIWCA